MKYLTADEQFQVQHKQTKALGTVYAECENLLGMHHVKIDHAVYCHYKPGDNVIWQVLDETANLETKDGKNVKIRVAD